MKTILTTLLPLLLVCSPVSMAQFVTGEELLNYCQSADDGEKSMCLGVIMGVRDTINTAQEWGSVRKTICIPENMSSSHLSKFVIKGLEGAPDSLQMNAAGQVWKLLYADFPCQ